jgi:hypothetical protein
MEAPLHLDHVIMLQQLHLEHYASPCQQWHQPGRQSSGWLLL